MDEEQSIFAKKANEEVAELSRKAAKYDKMVRPGDAATTRLSILSSEALNLYRAYSRVRMELFIVERELCQDKKTD